MDVRCVMLLACVIKLSHGLVRETTELDTRQGRIRGYRETVLGKQVDSYLGIPFAKPPVGSLRFQRPFEYGGWPGTWDGTKLPNSCPQVIDHSMDDFEGVTMWNPNTNISEDCLYLNVWTPWSKNSTDPLAVMVWIYGGGFYAGTSTLDLYDGRIMASEGDVLVVSMQYRIGAMGFLYLGISGAPGNVGLLDQQLALDWIFNNIHDYGGDNTRITIFGESAGAASVGLHMLSPLSKSTFHSAILQSATPLSPWAVDSTKTAKNKSLEIAIRVGCTFEALDDVLHCLRKVPAENLTSAMWNIDDKSVLLTPLAPVVDGYFLKQHPVDILSDQTFNMVPTIIGVTHDEGAYFLPFSLPKLYNFNKNNINSLAQYAQAVRQILHNDDELVAELVAFEYKHPYHYRRNTSYSDILDDIIGDYNFICPTLNFASSLAEAGQSVYFYQFSHVSSQSPWPHWMGALHGYEIDIEFGIPMNDTKGYTLAEKGLSQRMVQLWTNFAKTRNPIQKESEGVSFMTWPTYSATSRQYVVLNTTTPAPVVDGLRDRKCSFWKELIPSLRSRKQSTHSDYQATCGSTSSCRIYNIFIPLIITLISCSILSP